MQLLHPQISSFLPLCRKWLSENKHIKYLWIPYTDTVVVVQCNPPSKWRTPKLTSKYGKDEALQHVRNLYRESLKKYRCVHLLWFDHPSFNASLLSIFLLKNQTKFSHFEIELTLIIFCTYYCCIHSDVSLFLHYFSLSLLIIRCSCLY